MPRRTDILPDKAGFYIHRSNLNESLIAFYISSDQNLEIYRPFRKYDLYMSSGNSLKAPLTSVWGALL